MLACLSLWAGYIHKALNKLTMQDRRGRGMSYGPSAGTNYIKKEWPWYSAHFPRVFALYGPSEKGVQNLKIDPQFFFFKGGGLKIKIKFRENEVKYLNILPDKSGKREKIS